MKCSRIQLDSRQVLHRSTWEERPIEAKPARKARALDDEFIKALSPENQYRSRLSVLYQSAGLSMHVSAPAQRAAALPLQLTLAGFVDSASGQPRQIQR